MSYKKILVLMKVDMFQALNIRVDFVDADGISDREIRLLIFKNYRGCPIGSLSWFSLVL